MLAPWISAGLLVLGAMVGSVGAHLQVNAILALAGVMMALGIVASAFTEGDGH
ncbi:histidine kinase [Serratia marcescens]|nr:histidine kinase [Serratia marcescens]MBH3083682.1 histidine kinase [Serratia marcescens]MBH3260768.1 histidine kinase [Serratia marcescens]MBN5416344.1 histidine kinase [Serratia marcescens]